MNPDRDQLILDHLWRVKLEAAKIHRRLPASVELDDLYQSGALGLTKAADSFDGRCKFWTFAEHRVRGEILDSLRRLDHVPAPVRSRAKAADSEDPRLLPLVSLSANRAGEAINVPATGKQPDKIVLDCERRQIVVTAISRLSPRHREVVERHYFRDHKLTVIAKDFAVNQTRVCQIRLRAVTLMASEFAAAGIVAAF